MALRIVLSFFAALLILKYIKPRNTRNTRKKSRRKKVNGRAPGMGAAVFLFFVYFVYFVV